MEAADHVVSGAAAPEPPAVLTSGDVASLLGISLDEIDYWVRRRLIAPSVRSASGHGSRRLFGPGDVRQALLVQRLRGAAWKPKQIARALQAIEAVIRHPEALRAPLLVHEGDLLLIICRDQKSQLVLLDAAAPGQFVMVIVLDTLDEETRRTLARSK